MEMHTPSYSSSYKNSSALIIGIDKYRHVSPLGYAVSDAKGIADILVAKLQFPKDRVISLHDDKATKDNILKAYFRFASDISSSDDRIIVFFAGHGHTKPGRLRDVGFLVPVDGKLDDLSSLIRWDDLTKNAELFPAKHMLFLMDACYGGLAITRGAPEGSLRFMTNMMQRYGRQVITAGKANEVVADSGGPLPNHSLFTGHLLEALDGKACTPDGFLTGSGIMAYVYERVGKDAQSQQTPHYGFLEGDGDFIFAGFSDNANSSPKMEEEKLVSLPQQSEQPNFNNLDELTKTTKAFLSDPRSTIELHDLAMTEVRRFLTESTDDYFAVSTPWADDEFRARAKRYEDITDRLISFGICVAHWGKHEHNTMIQKTILRMTDRLTREGGTIGWLALKWYPPLLFTYASGIAAIAGNNFGALAAILKAKTTDSHRSSESTSIATALAYACSDISESFKKFTGHKQHYVPRSEYLYKLLQPSIDDLIFVGRQYEDMFDRFEVLFALSAASDMSKPMGHAWGPPGRFAYKYSRGSSSGNPLAEVLSEARAMKDSWPLLQAGLFDGSFSRFEAVAIEFEKFVKGLCWF